jgi:hypothetical protein
MSFRLILESHSKRGGPKTLTNFFAKKHLHDPQLALGIMDPACKKQRNPADSVKIKFHQMLFSSAAVQCRHE